MSILPIQLVSFSRNIFNGAQEGIHSSYESIKRVSNEIFLRISEIKSFIPLYGKVKKTKETEENASIPLYEKVKETKEAVENSSVLPDEILLLITRYAMTTDFALSCKDHYSFSQDFTLTKANLRAIYPFIQVDNTISFEEWLAVKLQDLNTHSSENNTNKLYSLYKQTFSDFRRRFDALYLNFPEEEMPRFSLRTPENSALMVKIVLVGEFFHKRCQDRHLMQTVAYATTIRIIADFITKENYRDIFQQLEDMPKDRLIVILSNPTGLKVILERGITFMNLSWLRNHFEYGFTHPERLGRLLDKGINIVDLGLYQTPLLLNDDELNRAFSMLDELGLSFESPNGFDKSTLIIFLFYMQGVRVALRHEVTILQLQDSSCWYFIEHPQGLDVALREGVSVTQLYQMRSDARELLKDVQALESSFQTLNALGVTSEIRRDMTGEQLHSFLLNSQGIGVAMNECNVSIDQLLLIDRYDFSSLFGNPQGLRIAMNECNISFEQLSQWGSHNKMYLLNEYPKAVKVLIEAGIPLDQLSQIQWIGGPHSSFLWISQHCRFLMSFFLWSRPGRWFLRRSLSYLIP